MKTSIKLLGVAAAIAIFGSSPASARNYDCTKAGNVNKTACKTPGPTSVATSKSSKTVSRSQSTSSTAPTARNYDCSKAGNRNKAACENGAVKNVNVSTKSTTSVRNYDCAKPGNVNKTVCKGASGGRAPAAGSSQTTASSVSYDCSKFYNRLRAVCRAQNSSASGGRSTVGSAPTPASRPEVSQPRVDAQRNTNAGGPDGATAKCRDGSLSHSAHRSGTCSRHGGVAQWY